jgi:hypothetical protein
MIVPEDDVVIACSRCAHGPALIAGAIEASCHACACLIWLAPTSVARLRPGWKTLCVPCALKGEGVVFLPLSEAQRKEIRENQEPE